LTTLPGKHTQYAKYGLPKAIRPTRRRWSPFP